MRTIPEWAKEVAKQVSLWQILLFVYMALCLLYAKIQELFVGIRALVEDYDNFFDSFAALSLDETEIAAAIESKSPPVSKKCRLLRLVPIAITRGTVWDKLRIPPSISLLFRLRHISKGWREFVSTTEEWVALEFTRLDTPGYECFDARWRGIH